MTLEETLKQVLVDIIDIDLGIYPRSIPGVYEERSDYQNGWNDCLVDHMNAVSEALEKSNLFITNNNEVRFATEEEKEREFGLELSLKNDGLPLLRKREGSKPENKERGVK